jgi:diguanylate cyclase
MVGGNAMNKAVENEDLVILVVDDLEANLYSMQQMLLQVGATIKTATSAEEGLKYMLNNPVHILILDYSMPQMNGGEMAELIRHQFSEPPPILFVTAHGHNVPGLEKLCYQTGAIDFIEKPVKEEVLLAKLNVLLTLTKQKSQLALLARIDPLTQIKNRLSFNDELKQHFARVKRQIGNSLGKDKVALALLAFDLDEFKRINDEYGHDAGDVVLKTFAERLNETVRDTDLVARLGGDEFMALLTNISLPEEAEIVARKIMKVCEQPVQYRGMSLPLKLSIGIALYPQHANSAQELLKASDLALYQAKNKGRGNINLLVDANAINEVELEEHLDINCQAVFDSANTVVGGEILASIDGLEGCNNISEAIQHFKQFGHIDIFERVVCDKLIQEIETISEDKNRQDYLLFINKSLQDLLRHKHVEALLAINQLLRNRSIIMVVDIDGWADLPIDSNYFNSLLYLANQGVAMCLQGVGEQTIPCKIMRKINFAFIKLSRSVIATIVRDDFSRSIVSSVCQLAQANGAQVVAVGVENNDQVAILKSMGCDYYQGNVFDKAISFENFDSRYIHKRSELRH